MAAPYEARTLHHVLIYALLYALAGIQASDGLARSSEVEVTGVDRRKG
jgi:hypothetical protein